MSNVLAYDVLFSTQLPLLNRSGNAQFRQNDFKSEEDADACVPNSHSYHIAIPTVRFSS